MRLDPVIATPRKPHYDVVIVGGAMYGSSVAWFLSDNPGFAGSVLVVERDPTYANCSTAHTNSCMRQQFSSAINVRISQFAADFVKNFRRYMGGDERVPDLDIQSFGYMYLADNQAFAQSLRASHKVQVAAGAGTKLMSPKEIKSAYPFYRLDDIVLASHNRLDEGYWDGATIFQWLRRSARERGVEYIANEVVAMSKGASGGQVESVTLKSGEKIACAMVVNASGPRADRTASMVGIEIPVEPRKRFTFIFAAEQPLERELPLTIDPSGVHVRQEGEKTYLAGCAPDVDHRIDYDDFDMDPEIWEHKVWPTLAHRIPQFEAIKLTNFWAGHYAYNLFDQNAIIGAHPQIENFIFVNGFSGHGLQQSPAIGRGIAELITHGEYRSLDLTPFHFERIARGEAFREEAVI